MNQQDRINLAGLALQGILERDTGWTSKLVDDVFYKKVAHHCVSLADAILEEIEQSVLIPREILEKHPEILNSEK